MSKVTVIWTSEALDDLLDIEAFIVDASKAEKIIDSIIGKGRQLEQFPYQEQSRKRRPSKNIDFYLQETIKLFIPLEKTLFTFTPYLILVKIREN